MCSLTSYHEPSGNHPTWIKPTADSETLRRIPGLERDSDGCRMDGRDSQWHNKASWALQCEETF